MKLADTLKLQNLEAYAAGSQATNPDSRKADDWIKKYLDDKQKRLNDLRVALHNKLDFNLRSYVATGASEKERQAQEQGISGSWQVYKDTLNQHPERMAGNGGKWAVVDREGLILSTWDTKEEAEEASFPVYHGIAPSATGPTSGTVVVQLSEIREKVEAGGQGSGCQGPNCGRHRLFYHGTWPSRVRGILKNGLIPQKELGHYTGDRWERGKVFVADSKASAQAYASYSPTGEKGMAIVTIKVPSNLAQRFRKMPVEDDDSHTFKGRIPASMIHDVEVSMDGGKTWESVKVKKLEAEDMFQNPDLGDKTRAKFLKHPKPKVVKVADWLRDGDHRPSSHGGGAAGTGGAGGPSGGGGGTS